MKKIFLIPFSLTIVTVMLITYEMVFYKNGQTSFLLLNLFLAWIPLLLSFLIFLIYRSGIRPVLKSTFMMLFGVIWLFFYPNAPYLMTDIIHIQPSDYMVLKDHVFAYSFRFIPWFELAQFILTTFTGIIIGFFSLFIIHRIFDDRNKIVSWIFVIFVSMMSGFGIYVGRFLRLNSWEILSIFSTVKGFEFFKIIEFSSFFGIIWFLIYLSLYMLDQI
ncbi:DUF1361 domain-containing protein [Athalassotoga sp.]|uniref:DUF1361 domain-containing protein n=1 Tax=Athalassotoga sp. TaxID=2022597 RepID=UPI003D06AC2B